MAMNSSQKKFADEMARYIQKYAPKYNIAVCSPILAQCILESGWGTSELAVNANNFFGLKYRKGRCPTAIGTYKKIGSEQNPDGSYKEDVMTWCKFRNKEDCVIGYFDFINNNNYANVKGVTSPELYIQYLKIDGYASSLKYAENIISCINDYNLKQYDNWNNQSILYRVQVGAYSIKANAEEMVRKLKKAGFDSIIVESKK